MCTTISQSSELRAAAAKGPRGWFPVTNVNVAYDHPAFHGSEHALLIDFTNYDMGTDARVAVEMDLDSARALIARLERAIEAAEATGLR